MVEWVELRHRVGDQDTEAVPEFEYIADTEGKLVTVCVQVYGGDSQMGVTVAVRQSVGDVDPVADLVLVTDSQ